MGLFDGNPLKKIEKTVKKAGSDLDKFHRKAGSALDDFTHSAFRRADLFTQGKRIAESSNPWEAAWAQAGSYLEGPFVGAGVAGSVLGGALTDSAVENGIMKSDHNNYMNDANKLLASGALIIGGTAAGGPAGFGAAMGAASGMGINALQQGQSGSIDWGSVGMAGVQGGVTGAAGGAAGGQVAGFAGATNGGGTVLTNSAYGAGVYGGAGFGSAYGETGDLGFAAQYGLASAIGGGVGIASGMGATGAGISALSAGLGTVAATQGGGGGGGGGNYNSSNGGDPNAGNTQQSKATKSVPEAEFLDAGGGDWGNAGVGGVFGGLDKLNSRDRFVDTNKIKDAHAQRELGAFVK